MSKASELFARIDAGITRLRNGTVNTAARARYEAAAKALTDQIELDTKAREHVKSDRLIASDLIFENAVEGQKRLAGELESGRTIDAEASQARVNRLTQLRFGMNAASLGFVTLLTLLFGRAVRRESPATTLPAVEPAQAGLMLRPDPKPAPGAEKGPVQPRTAAKVPAAAGAGGREASAARPGERAVAGNAPATAVPRPSNDAASACRRRRRI